MRGRRPAGPEYVEQLAGSDLAKERVKAVLETVAGSARLQEVCVRLDICEQRFHQLRQEILEGALCAAEPGLPGRRAHAPTPADAEIERLRQQVAALERELAASKARTELALLLPQAVQHSVQHSVQAAPPEKKTPLPTPRRGRRPSRPHGTKKNT